MDFCESQILCDHREPPLQCVRVWWLNIYVFFYLARENISLHNLPIYHRAAQHYRKPTHCFSSDYKTERGNNKNLDAVWQWKKCNTYICFKADPWNIYLMYIWFSFFSYLKSLMFVCLARSGRDQSVWSLSGNRQCDVRWSVCVCVCGSLRLTDGNKEAPGLFIALCDLQTDNEEVGVCRYWHKCNVGT